MVILDQWRPMANGRLRGTVSGHHERPDGTRVSTSPVVARHRRTVVTESGTTYWLGTAHPEYLAWLDAQGERFDADNPVLRGMAR